MKKEKSQYILLYKSNEAFQQANGKYITSRYESKIDPEFCEIINKIKERKVDIKNKTIYFLNNIEIKQEVLKEKYFLKTTKDPNKADYIIYGRKHIDQVWYYSMPLVNKSIMDIIKNYNHKMISHKNILTSGLSSSKEISEEEALKMFRMSCSDESTNQALLKTLIIDIDYKRYPLLIGILIRRLKPKSTETIYKNYYNEYYNSGLSKRISNIYTKNIDFSWIVDNQDSEDLKLIISLFNTQFQDFELRLKNNIKTEKIEQDNLNQWDL
jgi:hypothetical protein